jgi:hypothetical protein
MIDTKGRVLVKGENDKVRPESGWAMIYLLMES